MEKSGSRFEVTETHRWEAPDLIASDVEYPWSSSTVTIAKSHNVEAYHYLHITVQNGEVFLSKTISPVGMKSTGALENVVWKVSVEDKVKLKFSGVGHRTLKITADVGYKILSMYGVRC